MYRSWKAGVVVTDIMPLFGAEFDGYPYFKRGNTGTHDPLVTSTLCPEKVGRCLVLIATNLFWIT